VKKSLRFIGLVNFSLMLGFVMSLCSGYVVDSHPVDAKNIISESECNHPVLSSNVFTHTAHAENVVTAGSHSVTPSVKNPFLGFSFLIKGAEQYIGTSFSSNHYYLQNLFIRFTHTDLIFPFHYFW